MKKLTTVYVLLEEDVDANELVQQAGASWRSHDPFIRGIIDLEAGFINTAGRRSSAFYGQSLSVETHDPEHTKTVLSALPGVRGVMDNICRMSFVIAGDDLNGKKNPPVAPPENADAASENGVPTGSHQARETKQGDLHPAFAPRPKPLRGMQAAQSFAWAINFGQH